jgi:hypothetical protein
MLLRNNYIMKLSKLCYNYRVTRFSKDETTGKYEKVYDKLFSQLKDILADFPEFTLTQIRYISNHDSIARQNDKYKGVSINKINPIQIYK